MALDLASYSFGVHEHSRFSHATKEVFDGVPEMKNGYQYANEKPGWGMEVTDYPFGHNERGDRQRLNGGWGEVRRRDGTFIKK